MGHALQLALADTLVRMKRMQGFNTLFQPGYDHAGISTQNAVEKDLAREGKTRHDLGREAFEARVWEWLRLYGRTIMTQFRRIGASLDYRRERFTMDDDYVRAVMRFFVHLYEKGWIYRDEPDHQLVPVPRDVALRSRAGPRGRRRRALLHHVSVRGRGRRRDDRDRAARHDPGRRRGRSPSRRRALSRRGRARGRRPVRRAARARDRRRRGRPGVRDGSAQGDSRHTTRSTSPSAGGTTFRSRRSSPPTDA